MISESLCPGGQVGDVALLLGEGGEPAGIVSGLGGDGGGLGETDGAVDDAGRVPCHAAEPGGLFERREEFGHREMVVAGGGVGVGRTAGGERGDEGLAVEGGAAGSVGEAEFEDQIEPLFEQRGAAIPKERVLKYDRVVLVEEGLFAGHVDLEIGVGFVEIVKGDAGDRARGGGEADVDARFLESGMREEDEDAGGHGGKKGQECGRLGRCEASKRRERPGSKGLRMILGFAGATGWAV